MFKNNLCPSCRQIFGESFNYLTPSLSDFLDTRKCSKCDKVFSPIPQAYSEQQLGYENDNPGAEKISLYDGSSSWTNKSGNYDPLAMTNFQKYLDCDNNLNIVDPNEGSEFCQINSMNFAAETESNFQQQVAVGTNLPTVSAEVEGFNNDSILDDIMMVLEEDENAMKCQELSSITDEEQSNSLNLVTLPRFISIRQLPYSIETHRKVSIDEIHVKIESNLSNGLVFMGKNHFICQISSDCRKVFISSAALRDHLFSHFFFFYCTTCKKTFQHPSTFSKHFRDCKQPINESSTIDENSANDIASSPDIVQLVQEPECITPFWVKRIEQKHSTFRRDTREKVSMNEIMVKITEYCAIHRSKQRFYICLLEHDCHRSFNTLEKVTNHIFGNFYFYRCSDCGTESYSPRNIGQHLRYCNDSGKSGTMVDDANTKKKKYKHEIGIYRCLYCDFKCKPGEVRIVTEHLNGRSIHGKILPPDCDVRKKLKPADPETGLYEQLEPILVEVTDNKAS